METLYIVAIVYAAIIGIAILLCYVTWKEERKWK